MFNKEEAEEDRNPQASQEFEREIGKKDEDALTDVSKKLLSDDEGGFESFELAIKEEKNVTERRQRVDQSHVG